MKKKPANNNKIHKLKEVINLLYQKELDLLKAKQDIEVASKVFAKLRFPKNYTVDDFVCELANENTRSFWFKLGDMKFNQFAQTLFYNSISPFERMLVRFVLKQSDQISTKGFAHIKSLRMF